MWRFIARRLMWAVFLFVAVTFITYVIFFVAPNDLATSMGHIGKLDLPEVQQTVDSAITRIVQAGRKAGTLVSSANVERYTRLGVRCLMTSFFPWIAAGAKDLMERAAAGAKG